MRKKLKLHKETTARLENSSLRTAMVRIDHYERFVIIEQGSLSFVVRGRPSVFYLKNVVVSIGLPDAQCTEGWTCAAHTGCQTTPTPTVDTPGYGPGGFTATF